EQNNQKRNTDEGGSASRTTGIGCQNPPTALNRTSQDLCRRQISGRLQRSFSGLFDLGKKGLKKGKKIPHTELAKPSQSSNENYSAFRRNYPVAYRPIGGQRYICSPNLT